MPNYDYKCESCEQVTEVFQKISDNKLTKCSDCGGVIKRLISQVHFGNQAWRPGSYQTLVGKNTHSVKHGELGQTTIDKLTPGKAKKQQVSVTV